MEPNSKFYIHGTAKEPSYESHLTLSTLADPFTTIRAKRQMLMAAKMGMRGSNGPPATTGNKVMKDKLGDIQNRADDHRNQRKSIFTEDDTKKMGDFLYSTFVDTPRNMNDRLDRLQAALDRADGGRQQDERP